MRARRESRLLAFAAKLRGFLSREARDDGFDDEIQEHVQLLTERFVAQGMSREEATVAARRQFGNTTPQEDRRALQTLPSVEILWRDLRYAVRTLWRSPGFAAAAVLALALGIASNTAIFSVVHATFLAPLPYRDSGQLVMVWSSNRGSRSATAAADFFEWHRRSNAFSDLHVTGMLMVNLAGGDRPEQMRAQAATPGSDDIRNLGPASESLPEVHVPFAQSTWARNWIAVRTAGDPLAVHQPIAAVVRSIDPDLPMVEVRTMDQLIATSTLGARFTTILFGALAFVALLLAALGIYGVMAFAVAQRTHEIGLRIALGAGRAQVVGEVLCDGMRMAFFGTLIGSVGAYFVARSMRGMVPGVGPTDPTAFIVVAATLIGAALVACLLPARAAAGMNAEWLSLKGMVT